MKGFARQVEAFEQATSESGGGNNLFFLDKWCELIIDQPKFTNDDFFILKAIFKIFTFTNPVFLFRIIFADFMFLPYATILGLLIYSYLLKCSFYQIDL